MSPYPAIFRLAYPMPQSSFENSVLISSPLDPLPANKKQRTGGEGNNKKKKTQVVKTVKPVDPAVVEQRREAVQSRVLKMESRLAKDRLLLATYTTQICAVVGVKDSEEEEEPNDR
jgi:hypothetical protein